MPSSESILASDQGYRVLRVGEGVVFERPAGSLSPLAAWLPWGLGASGALVGIALFSQSSTDLGARADLRGAAVILFILAAVAFLIGRRAYRRLSSERRIGPTRLHLDATALRHEGGEIVAERARLRIHTRIAWTDGMGGFRWARVVYLTWPQGELPIFRSYDKNQVHALHQELAAQHLDGTAK